MLKKMKAYGHLKPGQKGTHRLLTKFGAALLCVRYRYDEETGENLTTAEIIIERRPSNRSIRHKDMDVVAVAVPYEEQVLREKVKTAGGRWDSGQRVWRIQYGSIKTDVALVNRIVPE
jgi:hypothetical protein